MVKPVVKPVVNSKTPSAVVSSSSERETSNGTPSSDEPTVVVTTNTPVTVSSSVAETVVAGSVASAATSNAASDDTTTATTSDTGSVVSVPKENVVNEIIKTMPRTNTKLEAFQTKIVSIIREMDGEQAKIETENRNNFNGLSVTLQHEQLRLEASRKQMKILFDETQLLNATIQTHYKKLIADTNYLQTLDAMRPGFLKSLDELASHIAAVKDVVGSKIIKDEYKDEMMTLLTGIHFNTHNISGYVATAFINHYNKYKALIQQDNSEYSSELKRLATLSNEYKYQVEKTALIENERQRLQDILSKLKNTLTLSVTQREEFDVLVKEVISIFDKRGCTGDSAPPRL